VSSLVNDRAQAMVGRKVAVGAGRVVKKDFQRWAAAVNDRNPLYFDDEFARAYGYREAVMPPLYLPQVTLGVVDLDQLRPDGIAPGSGTSGLIPLPKCSRWMAGGESTTFHEPVYDGDEIISKRVLESIVEKNGRSGAFVLITTTTSYRRQDGRLVASSTTTTIARP
jgi:acyl dehydratase